MNKVYLWVKKEPVLIISAICAVISMFFYGPSAEYIGYINFRVLCLLFSLMAVVAGFTKCGLFNVLAQKVVQKCHSTLSISIILVMLTFFLLNANYKWRGTYNICSVYHINTGNDRAKKEYDTGNSFADYSSKPGKYGYSHRKPSEFIPVFGI